MRMKALALLGTAVFAAAVLAPAARAEQNVPGSVLVFPYVDTSKTVISITNNYLVNWEGPQAGVLPGGYENCTEPDPLADRAGDTAVHLIFFQKSENAGSNCIHADAFIPLMTAQDHATFLPTDVGFPAGTVGWMVAFASVPNNADMDNNPIPWAFDFLSAQAWNVDSGDDFSWSYNAYPYLSRDWAIVPDPGTPCNRTTFNTDEYLDFNLGVPVREMGEYERWGDELILPRFFDEEGQTKDSLLALISPLNSFENQRNWKVTFATLFWDNDENGPYSRTTDFKCMFHGSLTEVSQKFAELGGTAPAPEQPTGWALFDGFTLKNGSGDVVSQDPPLLGVFAQYNTPGDNRFTAGANMFTRGFNMDIARIQYLFGVQ